MAYGKKQKKKYKLKNSKDSKNSKNSKNLHHTNEIKGIVIFALGILTLLSFYFRNSIGLFGEFIRSVITGFLGLPGFLVPPLAIFYSLFLIFGKNTGKIKLRALYTTVLVVIVSAFIQIGYYRPEYYNNLTVIKHIEKFYSEGNALKGGGVLGGLVSIPFLFVFQTLGSIIILTAIALIDIILLTNISIANFIHNLKLLFGKAYNKTASVHNKPGAGIEGIDGIDFEPEIIEEEGKLDIQFNPRVKDINRFRIERIEKASKELKSKTAVVSEKPARTGLQFKKEEQPHLNPTIENSNIVPFKSAVGRYYEYPPITLLNKGEEDKNTKNHRNKAMETAKKLEETLYSFGVEAKVINICRGPAVTRFELQPSAGVKVSKIVGLADDISLNLASSGVRIEAPIPGKAAIGIEVPNREISRVNLREVMESSAFAQHPSKIAFALGKDISGECVIGDIAKMPHLLIAGATGAGKSVCINSIIISLLYRATPEEVKLLMIDPKVVELSIYNGIPHLLIPVVTDPKKAAAALNWALQEMTNRYKLFADRGVRDFGGYNELLKKNGEEGALPQIVIIIDELADLMMVAPNEVEDAIFRLAQMARASGMHLVIATQRPSVDVITGVIKANIPSRISFAVSSQVDSRTILDMTGAEKLLGRGDMLYHPIGQSKPIRVQGSFISEAEVGRVVEFLKNHSNAEYDPDIIDEINNEEALEEDDPGDNDELLPRAIEMVIETGQASVSLIQRKFKVGYARAARIIDQMEARGIVGGYEGSKPRQILITKQQWQEMQLGRKGD